MGLGPIGRAIAQRALRHPGMKLVGAADPAHRGLDLGQLLGSKAAGTQVKQQVGEILDECEVDLVLHATGSFLDDVAPQFEDLLERGQTVVSTCEELAYPYYRHPELSRRLDAAAADAGSVLLGTGVNPGFVMDKLVITLMAACDSVSGLRVYRHVDAALRREPFQRKVGAGMLPSTFEEHSAGGRMGHIGLAESAHMLAEAMGLGPDRVIHEQLRPVLAERRVASEFIQVEVGQVAGIHQTLSLETEGQERIFMELQMYLGAGHPRDTVSVQGSPPLEMEVTSGVPGDEGTAAVAISSALLARSLKPGLRTMLDLPLLPSSARS